MYFELGELASEQGEWEESKQNFETGIKWYEEHENETDFDIDIMFLVLSIGNLGWAEFKLGNYRHAEELIERSLMFSVGKVGKGDTTTLHLRLATIEKALGNREKALQHAQEAYFWAERLGMVRELEGAQALLKELEQP